MQRKESDHEAARVAARALDLMRADAFPFTAPVDLLAEILHRGLGLDEPTVTNDPARDS